MSKLKGCKEFKKFLRSSFERTSNEFEIYDSEKMWKVTILLFQSLKAYLAVMNYGKKRWKKEP